MTRFVFQGSFYILYQHYRYDYSAHMASFLNYEEITKAQTVQVVLKRADCKKDYCQKVV